MFLIFVVATNVILCDPIQINDTPIQKIMIRPITRRNGTTSNTERSGKADNKHKLDLPPSSVIRVIDKAKFKPVSLNQLKFSNVEAYPIFHARAKANGSFRNHPIRSISSEWAVFLILFFFLTLFSWYFLTYIVIGTWFYIKIFKQINKKKYFRFSKSFRNVRNKNWFY